METLVRGYLNMLDGHQESYYFENNCKNIANFIFMYAADDNQISIHTIFGKVLISYTKKTKTLEGKKEFRDSTEQYLKELLDGTRQSEPVDFLPLDDMNGKDEFDCEELEEKQFEKCV